MDFELFTDAILGFFATNLPAKLDEISALKTDIELPHPNTYIEAIPDMTRSESIVFYLLTHDFEFDNLSNDSNQLDTTLDFFITIKNIKNADDAILDTISKRYAEAIMAIIDDDDTMSNIVNLAFIKSMKFYPAVEGLTSAKAINFEIRIIKEI